MQFCAKHFHTYVYASHTSPLQSIVVYVTQPFSTPFYLLRQIRCMVTVRLIRTIELQSGKRNKSGALLTFYHTHSIIFFRPKHAYDIVRWDYVLGIFAYTILLAMFALAVPSINWYASIVLLLLLLERIQKRTLQDSSKKKHTQKQTNKQTKSE